MIEFLWVLILVASLVGALHCRPSAGTRWERLRRCVAQRWRWWLLVAALLLVALVYVFVWNNVLRVLLNLLLFFGRHTGLGWVLLLVSLGGFILAWQGAFTARRLAGGAFVAAAVSLLLALEWYCLVIVLVVLTPFGLLLVQQDRLPRLRWACALVTTCLAAGLLLSRVLYGPEEAFEFGDYVFIAVVITAAGIGLIWALGARLALLSWVCGLLLLLFVGGLALSSVVYDVPARFADTADMFLFLLLVGLAVSAMTWVRHLPLQPLGWVSAVMILFLGSGLLSASILYGEPEDFADIEDQFKYGSIGSDHFMARGIPYYIWEILPKMFPPEEIIAKILPEDIREREAARYAPRYGKADPRGRGYEAFGLVKEDDKRARLMAVPRGGVLGRLADRLISREKDEGLVTVIDRPIGFSKRKVFGMDFVGINCAFCHVSTIRRDGASNPQIMLGMPANTTDIELFFLFLFGAAGEEDFTSHKVMSKILAEHPEMKFGMEVGASGIRGVCREIRNSLHRFAYRFGLIPVTGLYARRLREHFSFIDPHNPDRIPRFGPGRVDAWNPGKATLVEPPLRVEFPGGIIDHTSLWNQKPRKSMRLHWDGNTDVLEERNTIAGLVVNGPNIECLDTKRLDRINNWIDGRPAPRFDDFVPAVQIQETYEGELVERRERGRLIFQHWCAACHAEGGERTGRVEPLDGGGGLPADVNIASMRLDTDPARMLTFTAELANALNTIGTAEWRLKSFKAQKGYVNMLLDGIWLRAPYLHNGSVPSLRDLLNKPCVGEDTPYCRPSKFYRGQDLYDWKRVGFKHDPTIEPGDTLDITLPNGTLLAGITVPANGTLTVSGVTINALGLTDAEVGQSLFELLLVAEEAKKLIRTNKKLQPDDATRRARDGLIAKAVDLLIDEQGITEEEAKEWVRKKTPLVTVRIHKPASPQGASPRLFEFRTTLPGNSNRGHLYGTDLTAEDKDLLIEFVKTL